MRDPEMKLAIATQHVAIAKSIVARQQTRLAELEVQDRPTAGARKILDTFIVTLALLKEHQSLLRDEADGRQRDPEWIFSRLVTRTNAPPHAND